MLRYLKARFGRPVPWGAVALTYAGLFFGLGYAAWTNAENDRYNDAQVIAVVRSGQASIRNACEFDNRRAAELKYNLYLFLEDHEALHRHVEDEQRHTDGPVHVRHDNIDEIRASIDRLTVRNCEAEAGTLTDKPKEGK